MRDRLQPIGRIVSVSCSGIVLSQVAVLVPGLRRAGDGATGQDCEVLPTAFNQVHCPQSDKLIDSQSLPNAHSELQVNRPGLGRLAYSL